MGGLYVDFGYNRLFLCSPDSSTAVNFGAYGGAGSITAESCRWLYSGYMTALSTGKQIQVLVDRTDCNFTDGALPNPYPAQTYFLK
jgi:hypothetical protein